MEAFLLQKPKGLQTKQWSCGNYARRLSLNVCQNSPAKTQRSCKKIVNTGQLSRSGFFCSDSDKAAGFVRSVLCRHENMSLGTEKQHENLLKIRTNTFLIKYMQCLFEGFYCITGNHLLGNNGNLHAHLILDINSPWKLTSWWKTALRVTCYEQV